jgi:hypothetical protein
MFLPTHPKVRAIYMQKCETALNEIESRFLHIEKRIQDFDEKTPEHVMEKIDKEYRGLIEKRDELLQYQNMLQTDAFGQRDDPNCENED